MGAIVEYGIRINLDGNKAAADGIDQVTNSTVKMGAAVEQVGRSLDASQQQTSQSTAQLVAGQQQYIDTMRDQVATVGASRSGLNSLQGAQAGLTAATSELDTATARATQSITTNNGQMADTARIMRESAAASRAAEEANNKVLTTLQREIDLFGASRAETERYNAAKAGLSAATQRQAAALGATIDAMHRDEAAARAAAAGQDSATRAAGQFIKKLQDQVTTLGMNTQQLQTYRAAQLGVSDAAAPLISKLAETGAGAHSAGGHMEGLNFKTVAARRELLVLAHELSQGNYQKFGGSLMVLGEQTGAAGLLFSSAGLAALALTAAVAGVGYAMIKGAIDQKHMNDALIMTGNYAGLTSDSLNTLAHDAVHAGGSIGEAKKAVTELAASGKFTGGQIGYIAEAVVALEHATGRSIEKTIKDFEALAVQTSGSSTRATEAISRAAIKLDDTYHFLTESVYEQIRALEKEGDAKGASALATETLARVTKDRAEEIVGNTGNIARGWAAVKEAIGSAVDAVGNFGKKATAASDVKNISFRLQQFDEGLAGSNQRLGRAPDAIGAGAEAARTKLVLELTDAVDKLNKADAAAIAQGNATLAQSEGVHAASRIAAADVKLQKRGMTELQVALEGYVADVEKVRKSNPDSALITPQAIAEHTAALKKAHTERQRIVKPQIDHAENNELSNRIKAFEAEAAATRQHYEDQSKLDDMYRRAGELSDQQFYANKRAAAAGIAQVQISAYDNEIAALVAHNNRTKAEAEKTAGEIQAIAAKRATAVERAVAESFRLDEEERLRQKAIVSASEDGMNKFLSGLEKEAEKLEESNRAHEESKAAVERETVARLDLAIAYQSQFIAAQSTADATQAELDQAPKILKYLQDQRDLRERIAKGLDQQEVDKTNKKAAEAASTAWNTTAKNIEATLADAIANGGASAWKKLKAAFAQTVFSIPIQYISSGGASFMNPTAAQANGSGVFGGGASGAASAMSSGGSMLSSASDAYGLYSNGSKALNWLSGLGATAGTAGAMGGAAAVSTLGTVASGTVLGSLGTGTAALGGFTGTGTIGMTALGGTTGATAAGTAAAGTLGGTAASGGIGAGITSTLAAIPVWGWVAMAAVAAVALGGRGEKKIKERGVEGTFGGAAGFEGKGYAKWEQDGGWFHSDRDGKTPSALDAATQKQFADSFSAMQASATGLAKSLALDTDSIDAYSKKLSIKLTGKAEEDSAAISAAFAGMSEDIAKTLLTVIGPDYSYVLKENETYSAALQRLSVSLSGVNGMLDTLNLSLYDTSIAGGDMASKLVDLFGGLANMQSVSAGYFQSFYSEQEKVGIATRQLTKNFADLGYTMPANNAAFRAQIEAQDLTTEAGRKSYAQLMGLSGAFASLTSAAEQLSSTVEQGIVDKILGAQASEEAAVSGERAAVIDARRAAEAAQAEATKVAAEAFAVLKTEVEGLRGVLLLAGDAAGYLANELKLSQIKLVDHMRGGEFNASSFNAAYAIEQAKIAKSFAEAANADALNVQNISAAFASAGTAMFNDELVRPVYIGIRDAIVDASGTVGTYVVRDAVDALSGALAKEQVKRDYTPTGPGLLGIASAYENLTALSKTQTVGGNLYVGDAAIEYAKAVDRLNNEYKRGTIDAAALGGTLSSMQSTMGDLSSYVQTEESLAESRLAAAQAVVAAGVSSIGYYFAQIGTSAAALAASAETITGPIGLATAAIGRLNSVSTVFAISSQAALSMGGSGFDERTAAMIGKSTLIAEAASIASAILTTSDAAAAAKKLSESSAFAGLSQAGIRDAALLLDGLKQYDAVSFEKSFLRINDALVSGKVNDSQYQALFSAAIDTFQGVDTQAEAVKSAMQSLADAMGGFADKLLIDQQKTTLTAGQSLAEMGRQYNVAYASAMTGDSASVSNFQSLAGALLDKNMYSSQADYNDAFGQVYGDTRNLEAIGVNTLARQNDNSNVVSELKSLNANLGKKVDSLEEKLTIALAQIAKNTAKTANGIEQQNTVGIPAGAPA